MGGVRGVGAGRGLLQEMHPTAAVCGKPRDVTYPVIGEVEGFDRYVHVDVDVVRPSVVSRWRRRDGGGGGGGFPWCLRWVVSEALIGVSSIVPWRSSFSFLRWW